MGDKRIKCDRCDHSAVKKSNLLRHLKDVHNASPEDVVEFNESLKMEKAEKLTGGGLLKCEHCGETYAVKKSLESHISRKHRKKPENPGDISLFDGQSSDSGAAPKKMRKYTDSKTFKCPAADCLEFFEKRENLAYHYSDIHEPDSEVEKQKFQTETEFLGWLNTRNQQTCTTWKIRSSYDGKAYRICGHEGEHHSSASKNIVNHSKKMTGSMTCPAFLKTEKDFSTGELQVTSYFEHYGHEKKHQYRKLNHEEVDIIAGMMKNGLTNPQIVRYCDKRYGSDLSNRLAHLLVDDLRYRVRMFLDIKFFRTIRKTHQLYSGRYDDDDLTSVAKRVERNDPDDGILHYTPPDENGAGMRLIIMTPAQKELFAKYGNRGISIDDTHNSTRYSLKLTTIIVLNGLDRGIPVAYMLSSSCTSEDVQKLFECVKQQLPMFNPEFFMSDEAQAFWNGFTAKCILKMNTNIRVDEMIEGLYEAFLWVIRKLAKQTGRNLQKASSRRAENLKNCKKAYEVQVKYDLSKNEEGCYDVEKKETGVVYRVVDRLGCSCFQTENCHCTCGACSYRFTCSCRYSLSGISCKHVHLVLNFLNSFERPTEAVDDSEPFATFQPADIPTFECPQITRSEGNEAAGKIYDQFNREIDILSSTMRNMKKDAANLEKMKEILAQIQNLNDGISKRDTPILPVRRDANVPQNTARQTMNYSKFPVLFFCDNYVSKTFFQKREKSRKKSQKSEPFDVRKNVSICGSCGQVDPELPADMHEEEQDARITEWYRCSNARCHLPVHFLCATGSCVACQYPFEPYPEHDSEESFDLESSDDDIPIPSTSKP
ncbi:hypothetical protein B9Z55_011139 [Caenorhabditis nigoni]|uniref:C2H2-type domain-containing protein n=1 Tax=Caenorhabditis nigoni TaxID=1611254 RepID=A0A2G5UIX4_9PELO|nr:hypothetical protein B9Z55_011139 [Caenorhabditis nigoni]